MRKLLASDTMETEETLERCQKRGVGRFPVAFGRGAEDMDVEPGEGQQQRRACEGKGALPAPGRRHRLLLHKTGR